MFGGNVEARGVGAPSAWASARLLSGRDLEFTRGEEVVRYPVCEGCFERSVRGHKLTTKDHVIYPDRAESFHD